VCRRPLRCSLRYFQEATLILQPNSSPLGDLNRFSVAESVVEHVAIPGSTQVLAHVAFVGQCEVWIDGEGLMTNSAFPAGSDRMCLFDHAFNDQAKPAPAHGVIFESGRLLVAVGTTFKSAVHLTSFHCLRVSGKCPQQRM